MRLYHSKFSPTFKSYFTDVVNAQMPECWGNSEIKTIFFARFTLNARIYDNISWFALQLSLAAALGGGD